MIRAPALRGSPARSTSASSSLAQTLIFGLINLPLLRALALPLSSSPISRFEEDEGADPEDPQLWLYLGIALVLVLLGGVFAGLTIAYVPRVSGRLCSTSLFFLLCRDYENEEEDDEDMKMKKFTDSLPSGC